MTTFILRRLLISAVLVIFISIISFFIITLTPGSPYPWGDMNPDISQEVKDNFRKQFHLDEPIWKQYLLNMRDLLGGNLRSLKDGRSVLARITERLPATLALNLCALTIALTFGLLIGIYSSRIAGTWKDTALSTLCFALLAIPEFWVAYLLIIGLTSWLAIPLMGTVSHGILYPSTAAAWLDGIWHLALPATLLALGGIAAQSRYVRASMLETLREDYIRTAYAKGLAPDKVLYHHALRNSLRPVITGIGGLLPALIGGAVIIETIFAYPGIGRLGSQAVMERAYPTLLALNVLTAVLVLLGTLLADILYSVVDPRVRLE
ncbi:MAG: ABC transporter permease [Anaerorhabdus sp.]|uniref:ABC transporter permease n=1 Tax=Anaerorhabdus sp. TaxID=1872524 RepID=UPI003A881DE3